jgi:hypothetical protein
MESNGVAVTLVGRGLSDDELIEVADGLSPVDAETWASYLGAPPEEEDVHVVPTPTVVSPVETTMAPETEVTLPPPPPGAQHLVGATVGTERWHETTGACPTLDHQTDETVTMADGSVWAYRGQHCGELNDGMVRWRGGGSVTLTSPSGATITGTWALDWIPIPSARVQLLVTITAGTEEYAGAAGACLVDERMTMGVFAVDGNSFHQGTITCDVAV